MKKVFLIIGIVLLASTIPFVFINSESNNSSITSSMKSQPQETNYSPQSTFLQILTPQDGDTIIGKVTILWNISYPYNIAQKISSRVYYSGDSGENWVQLGFGTEDTAFIWDTTLYEKYGTKFKIMIIASSSSWFYDLETITEGSFTINNRNTTYLYFIIPLAIIAIGSITAFLLYRSTKLRKQFSFDTNRFDDYEKIKKLNHKVLIGLDYVKDDFSNTLEISLVAGEEVTSISGSIVNYFPTGFQSDLKSEIKGRTVMVLIEIAYQNPSETNPVKIADGIGIPLSTLSKEIKKLIKLNYVESHISKQVLLDTRYRNFKLTSKGFEFLNILNVVLKNTIRQIQTRNGITPS